MANMNDPSEVERILIFNRDAKLKNPEVMNMPSITEKSKPDYIQAKENASAADYLMFAEEHYAISRLLFHFGQWEYGFYCGQQMIETYLKAYIKEKGEIPKDTHDLRNILETCKALDRTQPFINGEHIEVIVDMFNPFNEFPRYPVFKKGPPGGVGTMYPHNVHTLDYFALKMRELVPTPENRSSLFTGNHFKLHQLKNDFPHIYQMITDNNINFPNQ
ncbi:HEPN domain-containing protein [Burkholderia cepacia]|uniref:HEPN domain-containing protein n=1 Tax=Burkholderia cepacia complex TaxID=87882 RepID=UPI001589A096|nr:HEPN domain-containing protein [Burkholderia cenocepacia]EKS9840561.1 HEPN domain-containing protein [Burkholderia cepacia]